jgi:excisionase family DNA binding protein
MAKAIALPEVRYLTKRETANYLRVSISSIDAWMKEGRLQPLKVGGAGKCLFPLEDIQNLLIKTKTYGQSV